MTSKPVNTRSNPADAFSMRSPELFVPEVHWIKKPGSSDETVESLNAHLDAHAAEITRAAEQNTLMYFGRPRL